MQAVGIIAEYNPFHNGHQWHLDKTREMSGCDSVVAVMSGNFVQRGEPALFDKWLRAELAVNAGVDLVLELPAVFAVRSAQYFATGSVRLFKSLNFVSSISFGAEYPELSGLNTLASAIDEQQTVDLLKQELDAGQPYAKALGLALSRRLAISPEIIASPNNILAIEYLRAIKKFFPSLKPIAIKREQANHNDYNLSGEISSATSIRTAWKNQADYRAIQKAIPPYSGQVLAHSSSNGRGPVFLEDFEQVILAKIRSASLAELELLPDVSEGLHFKLKKVAMQAVSLPDLIEKLKSKRYSRTRLQRILIYLLLGITEPQLAAFDSTGPLYARVLAFNNRGRALLRSMSDLNFPVITKTTHFLTSDQRDLHDLTALQAMLAVDTRASDLYALGYKAPEWRKGGLDFRTTPLFLKPSGHQPI